jgi:predicted AlkP superfamily phosphohydrolase/phosphomutase
MRRFAFLAISALLTSACGGAQTAAKRVIVLGFDGMDYRVTRDLMSQGRMPHFSRVAASGSFSSLETSVPPQSPVAWSSFITGLDPGSHGIFDFVHRDPKTMTPYLSTTETEGAQKTLAIGDWQFPLSGGNVKLLRAGQPFWDVLEKHGVRTTILRMPANFPPSGTATRELSGMGTPDVLGTYGTFSFFSSASAPLADKAVAGGRVYPVKVVDNVVRGELVGPQNPFRATASKVAVPFTVYIDVSAGAVKIGVDGQERVVNVGEWSDWVPISFKLMPFQNISAICRFYVKQIHPTFELYVSPINLDPRDPAMPISTPGRYASELARATGLFYTQGMPEDTKGLNENILTRAEFLKQAAFAGDEVRQQYRHVLGDFSDGLLFYYFGNLDQVSHMMWRPRDPAHPAYDAIADAPYGAVVDDLYVAFDQIVGETLDRMGSETTLIVLSDHGFTSWRRSFHLNNWLRDNGYLTPIDRIRQDDQGPFGNVDWSRTRAYGLGLNGLYINLRGRERWGIVAPEERGLLVDEIARGLLRLIDPKTGRAAVTKAYRRERIYKDASHFEIAPDLIVGYAEGTRCSNESALGGLSADIIVDNTEQWSGDHCMDHDVVPGILLSNKRLRRPAASLDKVAGAILAEFGIDGFPERANNVLATPNHAR